MLNYAYIAKHILECGVYSILKVASEQPAKLEELPFIILNGAVSICSAAGKLLSSGLFV